MASVRKINKQLNRSFNGKVEVAEGNGCLVLTGEVERWSEAVSAGMIAAAEEPDEYIVNNIVCTVDKPQPIKHPRFEDLQIDSQEPDVLIIGGGIIGCAAARELSRYNLKIMLVEKEHDIAMHATGHCHGLVHSGARLRRGSLKQWYTMHGNEKIESVCQELGVPFTRTGQFIINTKRIWRFIQILTRLYYTLCGHKGVEIVTREQLLSRETGVSDRIGSALFFPSGGVIDPQQLAIAYAENAVHNGVYISLDTVVTEIAVEEGKAVAVKTNRGVVRPKIIINAAGLFCEDIAEMAGDRFYSVHPVKSTNIVINKKYADTLVNSAVSIHGKTQQGRRTSPDKLTNVVRTVNGSIVAGTAVMETLYREDYSTDRYSADWAINAITRVIPKLSKKQALKYFSGISAATYNGDFIISEGKAVTNIIHAAGIQFPGITASPAIAEDIVKMAIAMLGGTGIVSNNNEFDPVRKPIPDISRMDISSHETLVAANPDYGVIVCHCENVSRGEIIDSLNREIPCQSLNAVKRRTHACCGDCQGECCAPAVLRIIASEKNISASQVLLNDKGSEIVYNAIVQTTEKKPESVRNAREEHESDVEMMHKLHSMGLD